MRLLKAHPEVELVGFSSRKYEGRPLEAAWPQLWDGRLFAAQEEVLERAEVVFLALPNGLSMEIAPEALKAGKRVVDLSGDFRLPPRSTRLGTASPIRALTSTGKRSTAFPSSTGRSLRGRGSWPTRVAT